MTGSLCAFLFSVVAAFPAVAQNSAIDFQRIESRVETSISASVLASANGNLYAVGKVNQPELFQTTPGAVRVQTSAPAIYVEKFTADGTVLAAALVADCSFATPAAAVDAAGNVYIAAATTIVTGPYMPAKTAVIKVGPQLDRVLFATPVFAPDETPVSIDIDTDGSAFVASVSYQNIHTAKVDPSGSVSFSQVLTDVPSSGGIVYDLRWVGISVAADHSYWVGASPMFMYHMSSDGKQTIAHISLGARNIMLTALRTDPSGNAYAAGNTPAPLPVSATRVDSDPANPMPRTVIFKFDALGTSLYTSSLAVPSPYVLAVDAGGNLWAAGGSYWGITLLELNAAGTIYLHSLTIPADAAMVNSLTLDASGRPLLAGSTNSLRLPELLQPINTTIYATVGENAFLLRLNPKAATADLKITLAASAPSACSFCQVSYQATIMNAGPNPATDVRIAVPGFVPSQTDLSDSLFACHTTGAGICVRTGSYWRIAYDSLQPGQTETVQFTVSIPSSPRSPYPVSLSALTSTDDPSQLNNNAYIELPNQTSYLNIQNSQTSMLYVILQLDNGMQAWATESSTVRLYPGSGVPVVPGSTVNVYVPTPQLNVNTAYAFAGWSDGSTENPRTFVAGSPAIGLNMRKVTEPWVNPDSPVTHAASYRTGPVAPGEAITLFGYNLGPLKLQQAAGDGAGHLATTVSGFRVTFDGIPAPVVYTSAMQSSVIVPYSVAGKSAAQMMISYNGLNSTPVAVGVTDSAPGLFTANAAGSGPIAALNSDGSINTRSNPARRGDLVVLFGSGEGLTTPLPADGEVAGSTPPKPQRPVSVKIAGADAQVVYAGGVTGSPAGLVQLNVRIPAEVPPGILPVLVKVGSNTSQNEATIAVQ